MAKGRVMVGERMLRHLAAAGAKRGKGRSAVSGMSRHAARAITIRQCLVEVKGAASGRPVGIADSRSGQALGRLLELEGGSREWMRMLVIKRQCDRREAGWQMVRERGVQELEAVAVEVAAS